MESREHGDVPSQPSRSIDVLNRGVRRFLRGGSLARGDFASAPFLRVVCERGPEFIPEMADSQRSRVDNLLEVGVTIGNQAIGGWQMKLQRLSLRDTAGLLTVALILSTSGAIAQRFTYGSSGYRVLPNVEIVAVYLGSPDPTFKATMDGFYSQIVGSSYLTWLSEYSTPTQTIGDGSFIGSFELPAPIGTQDEKGIGAILDNAIHDGKLPQTDPNTVYMVHISGNVSVVNGISILAVGVFGIAPGPGWCGLHLAYASQATGRGYGISPSIAFVVLPSLTSLSVCWERGTTGAKTAIGGETANASHELVEAITDPHSVIIYQGSVPPSLTIAQELSWSDPTQNQFLSPAEIADMCSNSTIRTSLADTFVVSEAWRNSSGACFASNPTSWVATLQGILF